MSELEFLGALHVELLRRQGVGVGASAHELFQTSTIVALRTAIPHTCSTVTVFSLSVSA